MNPPALSKIFILTSIVVPVFIYFVLPWAVGWMAGKKSRSTALLVGACLLFFISWYLPSPYIQGKYTAFTTHFLGGGVFTCMIWLYIKSQLNFRIRPMTKVIFLYFLVSGLGVANELFELVVVQTGLARLNASDTWWDLLANTLGALVAYGFYSLRGGEKKSLK